MILMGRLYRRSGKVYYAVVSLRRGDQLIVLHNQTLNGQYLAARAISDESDIALNVGANYNRAT